MSQLKMFAFGVTFTLTSLIFLASYGVATTIFWMLVLALYYYHGIYKDLTKSIGWLATIVIGLIVHSMGVGLFMALVYTLIINSRKFIFQSQ